MIILMWTMYAGLHTICGGGVGGGGVRVGEGGGGGEGWGGRGGGQEEGGQGRNRGRDIKMYDLLIANLFKLNNFIH